MSTIGSYKSRQFSESAKFLVYEPSTQSTALITGESIADAIGISNPSQFFGTEVEVQTATVGQTDFTLQDITYRPYTNNIKVLVQGVDQISGVDYLEPSSTEIVFTSGLNAGDSVKFVSNVIQDTNTVSAREYAQIAQDAAATAEASEATAVSAASSASTSETNAAASESTASTAASTATTAANQAQNSATTASNAATTAESARDTALAAKTDAINARDAAQTAESNASTSASNAATSESNAATSESNAATSASNAATSESNAATSEANALLYADQAAESATLAAGVFVSDQTQTGTLTINTVWLIDSSAPRTRDLPASPPEDAEIRFVDNAGTASANNAIIGRNGNTIMGLAEDLTFNSDWERFNLKFISGDWRIV